MPLRCFQEIITSAFTGMLTILSSIGRGRRSFDWTCWSPLLLDWTYGLPRLLDSPEFRVTSPGCSTLSTGALTSTSGETGWAVVAGWSISPEGKEGLPTQWVTSQSLMVMGWSSCIISFMTWSTLELVSPRVFTGIVKKLTDPFLLCCSISSYFLSTSTISADNVYMVLSLSATSDLRVFIYVLVCIGLSLNGCKRLSIQEFTSSNYTSGQTIGLCGINKWRPFRIVFNVLTLSTQGM